MFQFHVFCKTIKPSPPFFPPRSCPLITAQRGSAPGLAYSTNWTHGFQRTHWMGEEEGEWFLKMILRFWNRDTRRQMAVTSQQGGENWERWFVEGRWWISFWLGWVQEDFEAWPGTGFLTQHWLPASGGNCIQADGVPVTQPDSLSENPGETRLILQPLPVWCSPSSNGDDEDGKKRDALSHGQQQRGTRMSSVKILFKAL